MWQGPVSHSTSTVVTAWADPPVGAKVCEEGSFSGERCGTVTRVGQSMVIAGEHLVAMMVTRGAAPIPGDSGGPLVYRTVFGPLAAGIITATDGQHGYFEQMDALLFVFSLAQHAGIVVNTLAAP
jgi:hypothetical protein